MGCFKPVKELRFPVRAALRRAVPHPRAGHRLYIPCKKAAVHLESLVIYDTSHDLFLFSFLLFFSHCGALGQYTTDGFYTERFHLAPAIQSHLMSQAAINHTTKERKVLKVRFKDDKRLGGWKQIGREDWMPER